MCIGYCFKHDMHIMKPRDVEDSFLSYRTFKPRFEVKWRREINSASGMSGFFWK